MWAPNSKLFLCDSGSCEGKYPEWYFDYNQGSCFQFSYSGCLGNSNRFLTQQKCQDQCRVVHRTFKWVPCCWSVWLGVSICCVESFQSVDFFSKTGPLRVQRTMYPCVKKPRLRVRVVETSPGTFTTKSRASAKNSTTPDVWETTIDSWPWGSATLPAVTRLWKSKGKRLAVHRKLTMQVR